MPLWKTIMDQLDSQQEKSNELILEIVNYQYGYIGWCLNNNRKEEAVIYLKLVEGNIKLIDALNTEQSLVSAYKAAIYGFRIALSKISAPFNGPKSYQYAHQAVVLDPNQPFGYIQMGNVQFHMPPMMGGSKTEAIDYFLKAKSMMEREKDGIRGDWNYLSLLTTIAKAYDSINDLPNAKLMYEEILKFEPEFSWVRDVLYPRLLKRMENKNKL